MLKMKGASDVEELASKVPDNEARYHLFRHKHTHEGDYLESTGKVTHAFINSGWTAVQPVQV